MQVPEVRYEGRVCYMLFRIEAAATPQTVLNRLLEAAGEDDDEGNGQCRTMLPCGMPVIYEDVDDEDGIALLQALVQLDHTAKPSCVDEAQIRSEIMLQVGQALQA